MGARWWRALICDEKPSGSDDLQCHLLSVHVPSAALVVILLPERDPSLVLFTATVIRRGGEGGVTFEFFERFQ